MYYSYDHVSYGSAIAACKACVYAHTLPYNDGKEDTIVELVAAVKASGEIADHFKINHSPTEKEIYHALKDMPRRQIPRGVALKAWQEVQTEIAKSLCSLIS